MSTTPLMDGMSLCMCEMAKKWKRFYKWCTNWPPMITISFIIHQIYIHTSVIYLIWMNCMRLKSFDLLDIQTHQHNITLVLWNVNIVNIHNGTEFVQKISRQRSIPYRSLALSFHTFAYNNRQVKFDEVERNKIKNIHKMHIHQKRYGTFI